MKILLTARKRSLNDSLRVEYSVSGDDEVWIPPGNSIKIFSKHDYLSYVEHKLS